MPLPGAPKFSYKKINKRNKKNIKKDLVFKKFCRIFIAGCKTQGRGLDKSGASPTKSVEWMPDQPKGNALCARKRNGHIYAQEDRTEEQQEEQAGGTV